MGDQRVIVHLGLDSYIENLFRDKHNRMPEELLKNIGAKKDVLVRDVYNYLMNPSADELNAKEYTPEQKDVVETVRSTYELAAETPNIVYRATTGGEGFMQFDEKLSAYEDAFHSEPRTVEKYGNLEEQVVEEHVYLIATGQITGGRR